MKTTSLFFFALAFPFVALAQEREHSSVEDRPLHERHPGIIEIITTGTSVFPFGEEPQLYGSEAHLTYWFNHHYGTGLSYTLKFEDGANTSDLALLASWNPTPWMTLNLGPNFALPHAHRDFALLAYAETEINWRLREWFHIGPVVGTLLGRQSEWTLGFHVGFEFDNPWAE